MTDENRLVASVLTDAFAASPSRQYSVLAAYTAMWLMRGRLGCGEGDGLGGKFALATGFAEPKCDIALGATLAGAAFLGIDPDQERIKRAMRSGCCDFMVNNLDEALRVLKNELRKRRPVSVGLFADPAQALAEIVERGVVPDLLIGTMHSAGHSTSADAEGDIERVRRTGSAILDFREPGLVVKYGDTVQADRLLADWSDATGLRAVSWCAGIGDAKRLRALDALALDGLPEDDRMRRRWLELAPKYFRRDMPPARVLWLTDGERQRLEAETAGLKQAKL